VHLLSGRDGHNHGHDHDHHFSEGNSENHACVDHVVEKDTDVCVVTHTCLALSVDPVEELDRLHHQADEILSREESEKQHESSSADGFQQGDNESGEGVSLDAKKHSEESKRLVRMGINTAVAIGLHNFPEGLATFVAALDNPRVGGVLAFAIGIHNIPEGLCVALPVYYATGSRTKAFLWAILSGASEPFAALLGWAVLANSFTYQIYAILFGLVAGMMVVISTRELLPTAHRYDPNDSIVTFSFIFGMGVMALSLILFLL
jgi:zinc transporter ZupT